MPKKRKGDKVSIDEQTKLTKYFRTESTCTGLFLLYKRIFIMKSVVNLKANSIFEKCKASHFLMNVKLV